MPSGNTHFKTNNLFNVEDWVVLVTGGATGIGLMIAQAFANNGARVYIVGRRADALQNAVENWGKFLEHPKGQLIPLTADITDKASIENLAKEIGSREKKLDVLVNNAGVSLGTSSVEKGQESAEALRDELWKESWEDWETVFKTNVIGWVSRPHTGTQNGLTEFSGTSSRPSRSSHFSRLQTARTTHLASSTSRLSLVS
jgi:NAD(P)-dependent dehydrogenase (short-subunit alcohol dehydrogenase family)